MIKIKKGARIMIRMQSPGLERGDQGTVTKDSPASSMSVMADFGSKGKIEVRKDEIEVLRPVQPGHPITHGPTRVFKRELKVT